jgi:hypothetical protein
MTEPFTTTGSLNTAVLFLVFNRPDTTAQVFEAIRQAKPPRLYVSADGPREGRECEANRVARVREIATAVDWPCEVRTLFREKNLGCKYALGSAITWFFEHENEGIILEDDCLPDATFFAYCEWGLKKFRNVPNVWHINGNNFLAPTNLYKDSVDFSALPQVWGWATWSDRWKNFQVNPYYYSTNNLSVKKRLWLLSPLARLNKCRHIDLLKEGLDTWDYQWQVTVLNHGGLVLSSNTNLISNIGDGLYATHTKIDTRMRLNTKPFLPPNHDVDIKFNSKLNSWFEKNMGLNSIKGAMKYIIKETIKKIKRQLKSIIRCLIFYNQTPIVVASSGRSGSTMLTEAIADSFIAAHFSKYPAWIQQFAKGLSVEYVDRLYLIKIGTAPILKTHDVYREECMDRAKYIFVYGDPLDSVRSVQVMGRKYGIKWIEEHIYHLVGEGSPHEIFQKDVLNYENQILSWGKSEKVLLIHYEDIWDRVKEISSFLGFQVVIQPRRKRTEKKLLDSYKKEMFDQLREISDVLRVKKDAPQMKQVE